MHFYIILPATLYEATTDEEGRPDWLIQYTPGPKARAEYAIFMRQPGAAGAAALVAPDEAAPEGLVVPRTEERPMTPLPPRPATAPPATDTPDAPPATPLQGQAHALVRAFYQRFYGVTPARPQPKELEHAAQVLTQYGAATAHYLVDFSHQAARETRYQPQTFGGILHYLPRALAAYEARATQAATRQAAADERAQREQYRAWEQGELTRLRAALPPAERAALEAAQHARLVAEGTPEFALRMGVQAAVDQVLAAQAGLPTFEVWRAQQEAGQ